MQPMKLVLGLGACCVLAAFACGDDAAVGGNGGNAGTTRSASGNGPTTSTNAASTSGNGNPTEATTSAAFPFTGDVVRYDYTFDVATLEASSKLRVRADTTGNCFTVANEPTITEATFGGMPAPIGLMVGEVQVCGDHVAVGDEVDITTRQVVPETTFLNLDVGFSRLTNLGGGTFSYLLSWVGGCDHFGPCDDDPSRLTRFTFDVTHDPATTVLCPGTRTTPMAGITRCELLDTPAPTYSAFAVAADDRWVATPFVTAAGVSFVFYEAPQGTIADSIAPADLAAFFEWLTGRWGAFPYGNEIRVAGGPTAWLGFEHPANIILYDEIGEINTSYENTALHVLMHEIIHQWSGDRTTLASPLDFVWKEAIAEYMAYVWEDLSRPPAEAASSLAYWDAIALQSAFYPRPEDDPPPAVDVFYGDVYGPGPMTLFVQLEDLIGRDAVLEGIDAFLSVSAARSVEDLRDALATASGQNLDVYFDKWVFGTGAPAWPIYQVGSVITGSGLEITVGQTNAEGGVAHPANVGVRVVTASQTYDINFDFGLAPVTNEMTVLIPGATAAAQIIVDPKHRLINRTTNAAPAPRRPVWIF